MDSFAVLTADVQDGTDPGIKIVSPLAVAADLRHVFICKGNAYPSVSCRYDPGNIFSGKACFLQYLL